MRRDGCGSEIYGAVRSESGVSVRLESPNGTMAELLPAGESEFQSTPPPPNRATTKSSDASANAAESTDDEAYASETSASDDVQSSTAVTSASVESIQY